LPEVAGHREQSIKALADRCDLLCVAAPSMRLAGREYLEFHAHQRKQMHGVFVS
jgi:hypothetical protein